MTDPLALRAQAVNHPALAANAAIRRVAELEAEIAALRRQFAETEEELRRLLAALSLVRNLPLRKYEEGVINIIRLVRKGVDPNDGWAPVSDLIWSALIAQLPDGLVERNDSGAKKRCRLTDAGNIVCDILLSKDGFHKFDPKWGARDALVKAPAP